MPMNVGPAAQVGQFRGAGHLRHTSLGIGLPGRFSVINGADATIVGHVGHGSKAIGRLEVLSGSGWGLHSGYLERPGYESRRHLFERSFSAERRYEVLQDLVNRGIGRRSSGQEGRGDDQCNAKAGDACHHCDVSTFASFAFAIKAWPNEIPPSLGGTLECKKTWKSFDRSPATVRSSR